MTNERTSENTMTDNNSTALGRLGVVRLDVMQQSPVTEADHWLIPGLVSTSDTYVYGQPKVGKSFLVAQMVASLVEGRDILGRTPLSSGHRVLVVCTDSGSAIEYQERIAGLGIDETMVHMVQADGALPTTFWDDVREVVKALEISVVVFDHATGGIEGDFNQVEPWNRLWNNLKSLGPGVARILLGHATDSKFEGSTIHRPSGSFAASANARARVYLWAPYGLTDPRREVRLLANNLKDGAQSFACEHGTGGYLTTAPEDDAQPETGQERSDKRKDTTNTIIRLALEAPPMPQSKVLQLLSDSGEIKNSYGDPMAPSSIRNRLNRISSIRWDKERQQYVES